jgi:acetyl-CoA acyltransferase
MQDAVIVDAVRTPVGKRNGALSGVHPADLSAHVLNELVRRAGVNPALIDDVIWGCVTQAGEQTGDIARTAVITTGTGCRQCARAVARRMPPSSSSSEQRDGMR